MKILFSLFSSFILMQTPMGDYYRSYDAKVFIFEDGIELVYDGKHYIILEMEEIPPESRCF